MQKPYSLDYSIETDVDRCKAIYDILDTLTYMPSNQELEQMASYILYGKDTNGQNAVQRGEMTDGNKRYDSFKRTDDRALSLDELLERPTTDEQEMNPKIQRSVYKAPRPTISRPKYNKKTGELIDPGDSNIPGMQDLWDSIDRLEKRILMAEGKLAPDETFESPPNSYRLYQMKHHLIEMRRQQYYLKDIFKPTLHFANMSHPKPQYFDYTCDAWYWMPQEEWERKLQKPASSRFPKNIDAYETKIENGITYVKWIVYKHTFDWENPKHIKALLTYYDQLYDLLHEKLDTDGNTFFFDMERYRSMANLSPVRDFILQKKMHHFNYAEIIAELERQFGITYTENYLCAILTQEIPSKIALAAKRHRISIETPPNRRKTCSICHQLLPRDPLFFSRNSGRKDGFSSACKDCEKKKRIEGGQSKYDKRNKDAALYEMQAREK